ncbi:MAG: thioredoxin family protein [Proteobacteria bacterium]|nr:thioredoxin family protein [Pseudomonadota bacterium]
MTLKVQLLVSEWCAPCRGAEEVWQQIAQKKAIAFEVLDVGQREGRAIVANLGVKTVPATVIDGILKHVGVPTTREAMEFVAAAPDKAAGMARYVGLTLAPSSRWAIAAAAIYLALAGSALVFGGGIAGDAPWRAAALHVFGLGFLAFVIFGLGEHMLPRFTGAPIRGGRISWVQQGLAHAGTVLLLAGVAFDQRATAFVGGMLAWAALALFSARLAPILR